MIRNVDMGLEIDFSHQESPATDTPSQRVTFCTIRLNDEEYEGEAWCSPSDRFTRSKGRKIALGRAMNRLDKETRTKIWEEYFKVVKK